MDHQSEKIYEYIKAKSQTFFPIFGRAADRPLTFLTLLTVQVYRTWRFLCKGKTTHLKFDFNLH